MDQKDQFENFEDFVRLALATEGFLQEFDRLRGTHLSERDPLLHQIDVATGRCQKEAKKLTQFLLDLWNRLPAKDKKEHGSQCEPR